MNVWFNQCFSTIYYTIKRYKEMYGDNLRIIGTSVNSDHVFKAACDEFYTEPNLSGEHYVNWALNFCITHDIDIFFVKKNRVDISKHIEDFEKHGIKVVADEYRVQEIFDSKSRAYAYLKENKSIVNVPPYMIANSPEEFSHIVEIFSELWGEKPCYKFNSDEGGGSFRAITSKRNLEIAFGYPTPYKTAQEAVRELENLRQSGKFRPIIIMPYVKAPEISADCYNSKNGFVCTRRVKESNRIESIKHMKEIEEQCRNIQDIVGFKFPWNCQFRKDSITGEYKLLEINTRLSGGSHVGIDAGCWIGEYLIKDLLGETYNKPDFNEITIGKIEGHIIMEDN